MFDRILNKRSIEKSEWENIFLYEPKMSMLGNYKKTLKIPKLDIENIATEYTKKLFKMTYNYSSEIEDTIIIIF